MPHIITIRLPSDIRPMLKHGIPLCDPDGCPSFDGKRCRLLGLRPAHICEPALEVAADSIHWKSTSITEKHP
jgi:hypothetical protein